MNKVKTIFFTSLSLLITATIPLQAIAGGAEGPTAEPAETTVVQNPFEISVEIGTQSPWSKKIPIIVTFIPKADSTRTQISWDVPQGVEVTKKYNDYFFAKMGETYSVEAEVDIQHSGTYTLVVNVTDWAFGANYSSAERITVVIDENGITTPKTDGYNSANAIRIVVILIIIVILVVGAAFGGRKALKSLKKWLKPPA